MKLYNPQWYEEYQIKTLEKIYSDPMFDFFRNAIDAYLEYEEEIFCTNYNYILAKSNLFGNITEFEFLLYLNYRIHRAIDIIEEYTEHCDNTNKQLHKSFDIIDDYYFKRGFIDIKSDILAKLSNAVNYNNSLHNNNFTLDLNSREKIVALEKLGIIEFLKENNQFLASTNKMSKFLALITGEKNSNIQPMLNSIVNQKESNRNKNPLNTEKTVISTITKLSSLGIEPLK